MSIVQKRKRLQKITQLIHRCGKTRTPHLSEMDGIDPLGLEIFLGIQAVGPTIFSMDGFTFTERTKPAFGCTMKT